MNEEYKKLVDLIKLAQGNRSLNQFALHCNVDSGHLSRIINLKFKNPPSPDFIKKIASKAQNNINYEDLMKAAGYIQDKEDSLSPVSEDSNTYNLDTKEDMVTAVKELDNEYMHIFQYAKEKGISAKRLKKLIEVLEDNMNEE